MIFRLTPVVRKALYHVVTAQKRVMSYNCVKQALSLDAILKTGLSFEGKVVAIIGDGNGFMGILLKKLFPSAKIVQINLSKVLIFDYLFSSISDENYNLQVVLKEDDYNLDTDFKFIPAEVIFDCNIDDVDFFVNIASMQEMDSIVIQSYFELINQQNTAKTYFYCCNRISKRLPDGSYSNFEDYNWRKTDKVLFDGICDWYTKFPISRPPFVKKFDGPHRHKLIVIEKS